MATTTEQQNKKTVKAHARDLRIAPRKLRLVGNMVRGMRVVDAINQLEYTNKKGAPMVIKLIRSAVANAEHNFSMKAEDLYVKTINCDMGKVMKRYFPRARGSAFVIRRKMAHLNLELEEKAGGKKKSRFKVIEKSVKEEKSSVEPEEVVTETEDQKTSAPKQRIIKTSEQRKTGQIQQKRRLFNRKSGE